MRQAEASELLMTMTRVIATLAILPLVGSLAHAQTVRGVVLDRGDVPVPGVVIQLLDSASTVAARALSNDRGEFRVAATRPGTYRLRTMRIGYVSVTSDPLSLHVGEEVTRRLVLSNIQLLLDTVRVSGRNSCRGFTDAGAATFAVWEQVRTALTATQLTAGDRVIAATTVAYDRSLDADGRRVVRQTMSVSSDYVKQPWRTIAPEALHRDGFVVTTADNSTIYYAPGLDMLLSSSFVEDHCFRLTTNRDRLGVVFEPTPDRKRIAEIKGTLWIDRKSSELRSLEFRYENIPSEQQDEARGDMEFVRLPNGAWAITRWSIRMPVLENRVQSRAFGGTGIHLTGIQLMGGELALVRRGRDTLWSRPPLVMSGVVVDSVSERASAGATVALSGTNLSGVADSRGRFTITGVLPGEYVAEVRTPSLDSVSGVYQVPVSFADASTRIELRVPTGDQLQSSICGGRSLDSRGIVLGTVDFLSDSSTRRAATVVAEWTETVLRNDAAAVGTEPQRKRMENRIDPRGMFRLCGVPVNTRVALRVVANGIAGDPVTVEIPRSGRFARAALTAGASAPRLAVTGVVLTDSTHEPIAGAEVSLSDLAITTLSDPQGRFSLTNVPPGEYALIARRVGFGPLNTRIVVSAAESNDRRIYLSRVTMLDSVVVKEAAASPWLKEFEDNRRIGLGQFFTRDDLEKRKALSLDAVATELRGTVLIRTTGFTAYLATKRQVNFCPPKDLECMKKEALVYLPGTGVGLHPGAVTACYAQVYLDRMLLNPEHPAEPVDLRQFTPAQLEAMEYYDGMTATPSRYSRKGSECGVLVIHTRRSP